MDNLRYINEALDRAIDFVRNNKYVDQTTDRDKHHYKANIRSIRGDIKRANRYMYENINDLSKNDIETLLEKIVEIDYNNKLL